MTVSNSDVLVSAMRSAVGRLVEHGAEHDQDEMLLRVVEAAVATVPCAAGRGHHPHRGRQGGLQSFVR